MSLAEVLNFTMTENKKNNSENRREEQTFFSERTKASDMLNENEPNMSNIGEFSPNNPKMRVAFQPCIGLGEYDNRRQMLNDQRKAEYQEYTEKVKRAEEQHSAFMKSNYRESRPNSVEADQINNKNVKKELVPDHTEIENENSKVIGKDQIEIQNNVTEPSSGYSQYMDRIGAINNTSPRAKLRADLQSSCFPSSTGYFAPETVDDARFEKVRKQEKYSAELRQQVEEKKKLLKQQKEDEKHEDDMESVRMETQMRNLNFNKREGHGHGRHCYASDSTSSDFPDSGTQKNDRENLFESYSNKREEQRCFSEQTRESDILNEDEQNMLSIGEFSPNNPKMRVATQPYLGLGEYDHRRQILNDQRKAEYQQYTEKVKRADEQHTAFMKSNFRESRPVANGRSHSVDKAVQTDIKNVNTKLVHYDVPDHTEIEKQTSSKNKVQIQTQNNITEPSTGYSKYMDRIGVVTNTSPRAKLMADLQSSCFPSVMGYLPPDTVDDERFEKVRKQEKYLAELRQQVEEKQMLLKKHKEDEKHEDDLETIRMETQMRNLNFNQKESHGYGRHCYSSDFPSSDFPASINSQGYDNKSDHSYNRNKRMNEKRVNLRATHYSDTSKYTNSPPLSKRDKTKPPYSFNISPNSVFANSVPVKKRNSKLILNINNRDLMATKYNQSRLNYTNTNKLEESLPIPVLKARSPVAKELINALPVQSRTSDAMRKLEDKWQIPAVQKNIIKTFERPVEGNNQGVLTQLGAIRLQLQQEQLRLDETLRKRGTSQSQQTIYADIHRNLN